jgi:hypothetical protein
MLAIYPRGSWQWLTGLLICVAGVVLGMWLLLVSRLLAFIRHAVTYYRLRSPVYRMPGWPNSADLAARIYHAQTFVNFSKLEAERNLSITIRLFNASMHTVEVQSVTGFLWYDVLSGEKAVHVAWEKRNASGKPLDSLDIEFEQRVPAGAVEALTCAIRERKIITFSFEQLRIDLRAADTGELVQARLWQGVSCGISELPVVIGRVVTVGNMVPAAWDASQLQP